MPITVLICDDHQLFREGLRALLANNAECTVIGEASTGREAIEKAEQLKPNLVIMDMVMPGLNGAEATRQILKNSPETGVLALSMSSDKREVEGAFEAGVKGYVLKDCAFEEINQAIKAVQNKLGYVSPKIFPVVAGRFQKNGGALKVEMTTLSARETEVLKLIAEGANTKEVAQKLKLSVKTIESHRQNIMSKLNIYSIAELTKYAIRTGLTTLEV